MLNSLMDEVEIMKNRRAIYRAKMLRKNQKKKNAKDYLKKKKKTLTEMDNGECLDDLLVD